MQLFYLSILDKLLMIFREVGLQNLIYRLKVPCFCSYKIIYSKQLTFNVFGTILFSLCANFRSTCVIFCIHYASNFKIFSVRMFFIINTMFLRIKTLALKIEQSRVRSPGKTLDTTFLSIFTNLTKSLKSKKISSALKKKIPITFTKIL